MSQAHRNGGATGQRITWVGAIANALLIVCKFMAGVLGNSHALIADAVHSVSDLFTDFIVLLGLRIGRKAPDEEHPFGHARLETLASAVLGLALIATALYLGIEAALHIYGRVDDNTMILCGPLAHRTGVSDAIYGGDYVVASIGGVVTPGAYQFFGGYYLRTNSDLDWQVIDGEFMGRSGFSPAYSTNEISLYILTNPISKEQTLSLQTAINQLQTDLGRATH